MASAPPVPTSFGKPADQHELAPWSVPFCDCRTSDLKTCCTTCWCPCITFGQVAEIVDRGSTSCGASGALYALILFLIGCPCIFSCFYRAKLRKQYMLKGSGCSDCLLHFFCETCALIQEHRELKSRGFDMSLGWHVNMERMSKPAIAPVVEKVALVVEQGMSRNS